MGYTMLYDFIATHRQEIITRCQVKAAARLLGSNAAEEYGVPLFLDQLMEVLRLGLRSNSDIGETLFATAASFSTRDLPCRRWCTTTGMSASRSPSWRSRRTPQSVPLTSPR